MLIFKSCECFLTSQILKRMKKAATGFSFPVLLLFGMMNLTLSVGIEAQSRIYGTCNGHLVYFDYLTGEYDTVQTSTFFPNPNGTFGCTIDPYNGKYFYDASPTYGGGTVKYIDLNTLETGSTSYFEYNDVIEYNCLSNSLLFYCPSGDFYSYGLDDSVLTRLSTLFAFSGIIYGETRNYNPVTNQYFYQRWDGVPRFDIIDAFSGSMVFTQLAPYGYMESVVVDYQTGNYYGVKHDTVILFDPFSDYKTPIVKLPLTLNHLDVQMAVYDQDSSKYIIPTYVNSTHKGYYIVVDVKKKKIDTVILQPNTQVGWQRIYSKPQPRITRIGDSLFCTRGITYHWLCNNDTIPGITTSSFKPEKTGTYRVFVEFPAYSAQSGEIDFISGIAATPARADLRLYPNPAGNEITCEITGNIPVKDLILIEVRNSLGQLVWSESGSSVTLKETIALNRLYPGIYLVKIVTKGGTLVKQFVHY